MQTKKIIAFVLVAVVLGAGIFAYVSKTKRTSGPAPAATVRDAVVNRGSLTIKFTVDGNAEVQLTKVRSAVSGIVQSVLVRPGDQVSAGQVLLQLNDKDYRSKLADAEGSLADANFKLDKAKRQYATQLESERMKVESQKNTLMTNEMQYFAMLEISEAYSRQELELKRMAYESSINSYEAAVRAYEELLNDTNYTRSEEIGVASAKAAVEAARENLAAATIKAPSSGQVAQVSVGQGDSVGVNAEVVSISPLGSLRVTAQVSELDLSNIEVGMQTQIVFEAVQGRSFAGAVASIDPLPSSSSSGLVNYKVHIELLEPSEEIRSGMNCSIDFIQRQARNVLLIPNGAVRRIEGKQVVQVKAADGTITSREIRTGLTDGRNAEVLSGLDEGEVVLVTSTGR